MAAAPPFHPRSLHLPPVHTGSPPLCLETLLPARCWFSGPKTIPRVGILWPLTSPKFNPPQNNVSLLPPPTLRGPSRSHPFLFVQTFVCSHSPAALCETESEKSLEWWHSYRCEQADSVGAVKTTKVGSGAGLCSQAGQQHQPVGSSARKLASKLDQSSNLVFLAFCGTWAASGSYW